MDACPPEIANDIEMIRDEVKHWTSSLKAPKEWDSGETVNLKTKFCHFMPFGPNDELLSETMEIGERLLQWSKDRELPFHAYKHIGGNRLERRGGTQLGRTAHIAEHKRTMLV